ncbi:M4 family metallopeptidase [soil metagenome]
MSPTPKILSFAVMMALAGTAAAVGNPQAQDRALGLIKAHGAAVKASPADAYVARDVIVDADGAEHVRFDRTYGGLPVIGGDFVVHSRGGQLTSTSLTLAAPLSVNLRPNLHSDEAIVAAGAEFGSTFLGNPETSLVVYARDHGAAKLAYKVGFQGADQDDNPIDMTYLVDAKSGKVLDRWSNIETGKPSGGGTTCTSTTSAAGTGKTLFSGNVAITTTNCGTSFQMKDPTRGGGYTTDLNNGTSGTGTIFSDADNSWGNNTVSDRASAAADAHYGIATTWDYYKNVHLRNGIANDGKGALSKVHYGRNYVNAFWSDACFCMSFGDGDGTTYAPLVDLDVAGHEMTHGVTSRSANLAYSGESGGLNESTSDIFGTMVEFYANNASDVGDYLIGEKLFINYPAGNKGLRYMYHPSLEGAGRSVDCYSSTVGSLDVHFSSGPSNHFFYLLAEGSGAKSFNGVDHTSPTCNGSTVTGIGRAAAEKIWYRALTVNMTSNTNYAGARAATLTAATYLYGAGSVQYNAVAAAWSAVSVN